MFKINPSILRTTSQVRAPGTAVMVGYGADAELVAWKSNLSSMWVIVSTSQPFPFDCVITFGADTLQPYGVSVHGFPAWIGATYCIYRSPNVAGQWLAMPKAKLGYYTPVGAAAFDYWTKDAEANPQAGLFVKGGTAGADVTTNIDNWPRWESATQFGIYAAVSPATGTKRIGIPQWKNGATLYTRSLEKIGGYYEYGSAKYNADKSLYIIGTWGDVAGWNQGDEPTPGSNRTFAFNKPEGSAATGSSIILAWDKYVVGTNTINDAYIGEAAIWRI